MSWLPPEVSYQNDIFFLNIRVKIVKMTFLLFLLFCGLEDVSKDRFFFCPTDFLNISVLIVFKINRSEKTQTPLVYTNATRYQIQLFEISDCVHFRDQIPKRVNYIVHRNATRYQIQLLKNTQIIWFSIHFDYIFYKDKKYLWP